MTRPIIIVTGANGGLGYGICQRLLVQLSTPNPPDALPQPFEEALLPARGGGGYAEVYGVARAEKARGELLEVVRCASAETDSEGAKGGVDKAAEEFRKNVVVEVEYLDLASTKSVFDFAARIRSRYTYISHLMCNAGLASFTGINWALAIKQVLASPMEAVTAPLYYSQHQGELSIDGLGWVWQCNFFGHFALFRELEDLLAAASSSSPSSPSSNAVSASASPSTSAVKAGDIEGLGAGRVVWCSSVEASPAFYDPADWQLKNTTHSYESSKYQIDIVATTLDRLSTHPNNLDSEPKSSNPTNASRNGSGRVRHFVSQPGVVNTNVANALIGPFFDMIKICLFYLARWLGSPNHPISPYKGALAATHLALVPLACLALLTSAPAPPSSSQSQSKASASSEGKGGNSSSKSSKGYSGSAPRVPPVRFRSETDRWGEERVGLSPVKAWLANEEEGRRLVLACDALLRKCREEEGRGWVGENASEKM
ncbi:3-keto sterol reductase [Ephemerocybe angulata]|uniref:3-keto sterol reductase n=1 Tax=Ephemerocybe angulata TaxID=980116 RepID=A0A8H6IDF6_9AGAR|nr:3-keto sterol reductase [Tulosesus angulatus]